MVRDTDSHSSSSVSLSEQEKKLKKLRKKMKRKSEKKLRKDKRKQIRKEKKKHSRKDIRKSSDEEVQNPILNQNFDIEEAVHAFGPVLPPHLLNKKLEVEEVTPPVIGPVIPKEFSETLEQSQLENLPEKRISKDDDLLGTYGPLPTTTEREMTTAQLELEQRALEMKLAAIDGTNAPINSQNVREEWMLELPDVGLKSGLAALNNLKRGFHQGKEKPDFSDRTSWTKTPNSCREKEKPTSSKEKLELSSHEKQRDAEQEAIAKKLKKEHKREESLVEIHQKKLREEEKKRAKELKATGNKPQRRPFTRDVDLKLNKIDRNQTKQIVDKAKILNTKFSSGQSKYL